MPSQQDFIELNTNCTSTWLRRNGVLGRFFVSNINGESIFIPAIGYYDGTVRNAYEVEGRYWSNKYHSETNALAFGETSSSITVQAYGQRHYGYPIRPVKSGTPNRSVVPPSPEEDPEEPDSSLRKKKASKKKDDVE